MIFHIGPYDYTLRIVAQRPRGPQGQPLDGLVDLDRQVILLFAGLGGQRRLGVLLHELRHAWKHHFPHQGDDEGDCDLAAHYAQSAFRDLLDQGGTPALEELSAAAGPSGGGGGGNPRSEYRMPNGEEWITSDDAGTCEDGGDCGASGGSGGIRHSDFGTRHSDLPRRLAPPSNLPTVSLMAHVRGRAGRAECGACGQLVADGSIVNSDPYWHPLAKGRVLRRTLYCDACHHLQTWEEGVDFHGAPNGTPLEPQPQYVRDLAEIEDFLREHPQATRAVDGE